MNWDTMTLKGAMIAKNPHPELEEKAYHDENGEMKPLLGYMRCDYDGYRWWNTCWHVHKDLFTKPLAQEFDSVMEQFRKEFPDLDYMTEWCESHASRLSSHEYNAFFDGELGFYWFRFRTIPRDYNLYLYCISKEAMAAVGKEN